MSTQYFRRLALAFALAAALTPLFASAHQPRLVEGPSIEVPLPEVSKAYYGTLTGSPHIFHIVSDKPFALYVNILVPDIANQKTDVSAVIVRRGGSSLPLALIGGRSGTWTPMFEAFGHDNYLQSGEYKAEAEPGEYDIWVSSAENNSKYSLAVGEQEDFNPKEIWNALVLVPQLKRDFFNESPISFILSPMGIGYIVVMFALAAIFGFLYRFLLRKLAARSVHKTPRVLGKNIGKQDRAVRAFLGLGLFLLAITTSWSAWLLFFAGFCLFEAVFSWCGLYAAMGRTTCPIE